MIPKRKSKKQRPKYYDNIIDTYLGETQSGMVMEESLAPAVRLRNDNHPPHDFVPLTDYYVGQEYQSDTVTDYTPPSMQLSGQRYQCPQNLPSGVDETTEYMSYTDTYKPLYPRQASRLTVEALPPNMFPRPSIQEETVQPLISQEAPIYYPPSHNTTPQYIQPTQPTQPPQQFTQQQIIELSLFLAGGAILIMILEQFVQMGALLRGY